MHLCNRVLLLFGKLPQWNLHVYCHVNGTTFQSSLRFQIGLSSLLVSCKRAPSVVLKKIYCLYNTLKEQYYSKSPPCKCIYLTGAHLGFLECRGLNFRKGKGQYKTKKKWMWVIYWWCVGGFLIIRCYKIRYKDCR